MTHEKRVHHLSPTFLHNSNEYEDKILKPGMVKSSVDPLRVWTLEHRQDWSTLLTEATSILSSGSSLDPAVDRSARSLQALAYLGLANRSSEPQQIIDLRRTALAIAKDVVIECRKCGLAEFEPDLRRCLRIINAVEGQRHSFINEAVCRQLRMNRAVVQEYLSLSERTGADCCVIFARQGERLEVAGTFKGAAYLPPVPMMSSTKSIFALAAAMLVERGLLNFDDPVHRWMPDDLKRKTAEYRPPADIWPSDARFGGWDEGLKQDVTVRHLLTHTSGLPGNEFCRAAGVPQFCSWEDVDSGAACLPVVAPPGHKFDYSNAGTQLLAPLLSTAANVPIGDFIDRELLARLEMKDSALSRFGSGQTYAFQGLISTPEDFAKVGLLVMNHGRLNGEQIIASQLVKEILTASDQYFPGGTKECAHLWWSDQAINGFGTRGYLGTDMHVWPERGLVVVRTQESLPEPKEYHEFHARLLKSL